MSMFQKSTMVVKRVVTKFLTFVQSGSGSRCECGLLDAMMTAVRIAARMVMTVETSRPTADMNVANENKGERNGYGGCRHAYM